MAALDVIRVDETSTRAQLVEALGHLNQRCKREFPVVGDEEHKTPWDERHASVNDLLTLLEVAQG